MIRIYGRPNSSNVQKVLWACDELGVPFELTLAGRSHGGTGEAWFRAMNPNGLVPVVVDRGEALWESNTILRYLAAAYGDGRLWPADPLARARAERWMDWQLSTLNPPMSTIFHGLVRTPEAERDMAAIGRARVAAAERWAMVDRHLAGSPFVGGEAFGLADIALGMFGHRFTILVPDHGLANVAAWYGRLAERPAFRERVMQPLT